MRARWALGAMLLAATAQAYSLQLTEQVNALKPDQTLVLATTGNAVLAGLFYPDGDLAQAWLAQHALQQKIAVTPGDEDRYGRIWIMSDLQTSMLRDGAAIIYGDMEVIPSDWAGAEHAARAAKKGVWGKDDFALVAQNAAQHYGEFHVVEGLVTSIYRGKTATSINFGDDWHTDFSISISGRARSKLKDILATIKPGVKLRTRGMIVEENGPMIHATSALQLERF